MATHVCPWWMGYLLASPIRKLHQNPQEILSPHIEPGMTAVDLGCGMGFFSIPMARLVGPEGRVICVDLQQRMLTGLMKRATRAGVAARVQPHCCETESLGLGELEQQVDFALAFAVVHEVPDQERFFKELVPLLSPGGKVLVAEPSGLGHVKPEAFERSLGLARAAGLVELSRVTIPKSHAVLLGGA